MSFRRGIKVLPLRPLLQQNEPPQKAHPNSGYRKTFVENSFDRLVFSRVIYRIFPSKNIV